MEARIWRDSRCGGWGKGTQDWVLWVGSDESLSPSFPLLADDETHPPQVRHVGVDDFSTGDEVVLTLADRGILDDKVWGCVEVEWKSMMMR